MLRTRFAIYVIIMALGMLALGVCAQPRALVYVGDSVPVGNGYARSYVTVDSAGKPSTIGMVLTEDALDGLPAMDAEYVLPMPREVAVPPFTEVVLNWNVHGHIPPGIYDVPHFDFHFYMISPAVREGITATGEDLAKIQKKPAQEYTVPGYFAAPGGELPHMGGHWVPYNAPEFHGGKFSQTFIYGYYNGQMAFMEPMITPVYLQSHPSYYSGFPLPRRFPEAGYYPTGYAIKYDPAMGRYVVALTGMRYRP